MQHNTNYEGVTAPSSFPPNSGVSLKPCWFEHIVENQPEVGFFEIHAENYLAPGGPNTYYLERIRRDYPFTVHGVGLSIGGEEPLNHSHLNRVAELVKRSEPIVFSEHLAWSSHFSHFYNDLLPLPYTETNLSRVCQHIEQVQDTLKRTILIENPATYLSFKQTDFTECEFITQMAQRTGCQLLLDINNVAVSCFNHQQDPIAYLDHFPLQQVRQLHLAGYTLDPHSRTPLRIDSHDQPVSDEVWILYQDLLQRTGDLPTLIEWDGQLPPFEQLQAQAQIADHFRKVNRQQHMQVTL